MDRALDPGLLAEALGQHTPGVLPTVDKLTALIVELEVRTFVQPTIVDEELLHTAWYLHGVASAQRAEYLYEPARQERAFAVSAHIFDLALGSPGRSSHDLLTLAFGAQVGYRRANLEPNASAIWRRIDHYLDHPLSSDVESPESTQHKPDCAGDVEIIESADIAMSNGLANSLATLALRAGVALLGLDVRRIQFLLARWQKELGSMRELLDQHSLTSTMFGPAEAVVQAVSDLMVFLRYGDRDRLQAAHAKLKSVVTLETGQGDHDARWVAIHILQIAEGMETSSVWSVLPEGTPPIVAQAFTIGTPPVLTLWPPQRELLTRSSMNPLDPATQRLLLSVPTSAGKTLIAQIIICHHLVTQPGSVCYVTPLRSLGREMRQALAGRLRIIHKGLGPDLADFGNFNFEQFFEQVGESTDASVEVMTPERLSHLLRHDPYSVLEQYSMFVIDEAHLLAQPGRGFLLESILATVTTTEARVVLLSGVMGNAHQIATWLNPAEEGTLFESGWRGPRRMHALFYTHVEWDAGQLLPPKSKTFTRIERYPITAEIRVRPIEGSARRLVTNIENPIGHLERKVRPPGAEKPYHDRYDAFYKMCARTARRFLHAGSLLMILSQRAYARTAAQEITAQLEPTNATDELREFLIERLGAEHPLVECVRHGVAYHHAGLPTDVLDELEQALRAETLNAVFATSTLTDGVNLPVRTVVICETRYEGQDPGQQLDGPRLLNAVGRAGRAGKETEGWIVLGLNQRPHDSDFDRLQPENSDLNIISTLSSEAALANLAELEALIATTADALFTIENGVAADFATHVWFVLSAQERLTAFASETNLEDAIDKLLAFDQLPPGIAARWMVIADYVREQYETTNAESRLRWTLTGTSLSSSRHIENIASTLATEVLEHFREFNDNFGDSPATPALGHNETIQLLDQSGALTSLLQLPEGEGVWRFKPTVGARTTIDVSITDALRDWLAGVSIPSLAERILPEVADSSWRLEQTVDAISGTFEHFLSWTIGVVITQANELLTNRGAFEALPNDFAQFARYGVNTTIALNLLTNGIRSRRLAHVIGRHATSLGLDWAEVRDWLRALHIADWKTEFATTRREIEELVDFCRSPGVSPLRQLLEEHVTRVELNASTVLPPTVDRLPAEVRITQSSEPIEVWTSGTSSFRVGIIAASSHADVALLALSGLDFRAETDGESVILYEVR